MFRPNRNTRDDRSSGRERFVVELVEPPAAVVALGATHQPPFGFRPSWSGHPSTLCVREREVSRGPAQVSGYQRVYLVTRRRSAAWRQRASPLWSPVPRRIAKVFAMLVCREVWPLGPDGKTQSANDKEEDVPLAIAGTGYGVIGVLVIILLVVLIFYFLRRA